MICLILQSRKGWFLLKKIYTEVFIVTGCFLNGTNNFKYGSCLSLIKNSKNYFLYNCIIIENKRVNIFSESP